MKIILVGLPYFVNKIGAQLKNYAPENSYVLLDTYYNNWDKLRYLYHVLSADLIYSINGAITGSRVFDLAIRLNKKVIMHWVGTDIVTAQEQYQNGKHNEKYISKAIHFCEAKWSKIELGKIGIEAEIVGIAGIDILSQKFNMPAAFSLLSYIPEHREDFYGIKRIISLAKALPDISIRIVGMSRSKYSDFPKNIQLLGWVNNMSELIRESIICLRLPEHDGLSFFVLEAMAHERYVVYVNDFPNCYQYKNDNDLIDYVNKTKEKFDNKTLGLNEQARAYIIEHHDTNKILSDLIKKFKSIGE